MDTSAFWEGFEHEQKSDLRSRRIATEVTRSPQQQPTDQEALISRLQLKASAGDYDVLATLRMLESMHGAYNGGRPMRMSVSPPVDQRVRSDARNLSPGTMFNVPSATHQMLAHLAGQRDEEALSTLRMLEAVRLMKMHSSPMGGKPAPPEPKEKEPVPKRIDTVKVTVKAIDLSTPEGSENSLYMFSSTCRALGTPRAGLNLVEEEALALLVDMERRGACRIQGSCARPFHGSEEPG